MTPFFRTVILSTLALSIYASPITTVVEATATCTVGSETRTGSGCEVSNALGYATMTARGSSSLVSSNPGAHFSEFRAELFAGAEGTVLINKGETGAAHVFGSSTTKSSITLIAEKPADQGPWGWTASNDGEMHAYFYSGHDGTFGGNGTGRVSFDEQEIYGPSSSFPESAGGWYSVPFTVGVPFTITMEASTRASASVESDGNYEVGIRGDGSSGFVISAQFASVAIGTGWEMGDDGVHHQYSWKELVPMRLYDPATELPTTTTPEPGTFAMLGVGLLACAYRLRRG